MYVSMNVPTYCAKVKILDVHLSIAILCYFMLLLHILNIVFLLYYIIPTIMDQSNWQLL